MITTVLLWACANKAPSTTTKAPAETDTAPPPEPIALRVATFNTALSRDASGALAADLAAGDAQAEAVAAVIQATDPDILVLQEFDVDESGALLEAFVSGYLPDADYPHRYIAPSNTGLPSGLDLDNDGAIGGAGDAWGYGTFEGQYGFAVLSRYPLEPDTARTFQTLRWADKPGAQLPADWFTAEEAAAVRLSSKNHVDLSAVVGEQTLHLLISHPTPPVFDGPEDRNGLRNHDEIGLWADYLDDTAALVDDAGAPGGLTAEAHFVLLGDLNADPDDGDSIDGAIDQVLSHSRVHIAAAVGALRPHSDGAQTAGNAWITTSWGLRVDYALPSASVEVLGSGVYWPASGEEGHESAEAASDHRLVWVDIEL